MKNNLTKRKVRSLESRKKIFETAVHMIQKKGFDNVTVDEICAKLQISKGLFYHFFYSKDEIVIEQFLDTDKAYKKIVEEKLKNYSGIDKLLKFTEYQYKYVKGYFMGRDLLKNIYRSSIINSKMAHSLTNEKRYLYKFLNETIKEAQAKKELPSDISTKKIASQVAILMRGIFYNWCLYERGFHLEETGIEIILTFLNGLKHKVAL